MELHKNVVEEALRRANDAYGEGGDDDIRPYYGYSGRGMYGATCFGVVTNLRGYSHFLLALHAAYVENEAMSWDEFDDPSELIELVAMDSLGTQTIFYFPKVTVVE